MRSFGPDVRAAALLTADTPGNTIKAEAFQDNLVLDFAGASVVPTYTCRLVANPKKSSAVSQRRERRRRKHRASMNP